MTTIKDWAYEEIVRRLAETSGIHMNEIGLDDLLANYIEDSLDFVELMTALEEDFGLGEVTEGSLRTVRDLVELVRASRR